MDRQDRQHSDFLIQLQQASFKKATANKNYTKEGVNLSDNVVNFFNEEVFLIRTFIELISETNLVNLYKIGCERNKTYVTDDLMKQVENLTSQMIKIMPREIKLHYISEKMDIVNFRIRIKGQGFKGYAGASEALQSEFESEIQIILKKLENNFNKVMASK